MVKLNVTVIIIFDKLLGVGIVDVLFKKTLRII